MATDTVIITNVNWRTVNVEVRQGNNGNPESNPSLGTRALANQQQWVIYSDALSIWYRRDADPDNPNGVMNPWTEVPCYGLGETKSEEI